MQAVQVVVEVSYVKNPRFFVVESVELADTSKLQKTPNDSASLSRKTVSFMGWKSYLIHDSEVDGDKFLASPENTRLSLIKIFGPPMENIRRSSRVI